MRDFLRRMRLPLLFGALLLATLLFMLGDRRSRESEAPWPANGLIELAAPLSKAITSPVDFLGETWASYVSLRGVRADNEVLRARVEELLEENTQFREALVASGHLDRIAGMRKDFEVPLLPSQVVGQDVTPFFRSVLLDRGRGDAVRSGMPVLSSQGVVGLVTATSPGASRAMMLIDRRTAVDAIVQRSRARGIVRGTGTGALEFVFMVRGDDVVPGDAVITSGVGGVYPKGLRVGIVGAVDADPSELLHRAEVRPAVDFGRLEQVFVMLQRGPTMDLLYAADGDQFAPEETP